MIKEHIRDYAVEAFRFYAAKGRPGREELRNGIYRQAIEAYENSLSGAGCDGHLMETALVGAERAFMRARRTLIRAERAFDEQMAQLLDLLAVHNVLLIIEESGYQNSVGRAIEEVYFKYADKPLGRCDIQMRVHKAEIEFPASERQIYRWLKDARQLFAAERGLRF